MKSDFKINMIFGLSLFFIIMNCTNPVESSQKESNKKIVHFEEQWVQPPPSFDTTLLSSITEFNRNGKPIEKSQYSRIDGSLLILTKWTYDLYGNITEKITTNTELKTTVTENYSFEYDDKGRKIKGIEKNSNNTVDLAHIYEYSEDGSYTDTISYQSQLLSIMSYNKNDKMIKSVNIPRKKIIYNEYDEYGNFIKRKTAIEGKPDNVKIYTNEYDSNGNRIRARLDSRHREYEYNENGDLVVETWLNNDQPYRFTLYKYKYYE